MKDKNSAQKTIGIDKVDYTALDKAKIAFIEASRKTLSFANNFGFVPADGLGASANLFSLDLSRFLSQKEKNIYISLIAEGLGTADDARPEDLSDKELEYFWHNIGIKTIASFTNDAASAALQTILISLYLPSSAPEQIFNSNFLNGFTSGIIEACKKVACVWISGETPQLKGKIFSDKLDIAGSAFAIMPEGNSAIDSSKLAPGNNIVLVGSSGPHENGFTTLRALAAKLPHGYRTKLPSGQEFWRAINAPSVLYTPLIQALLKAKVSISNLENITGHGWLKIMRSKKELCYRITNILPQPEIFSFVQEKAELTPREMLKTFNCGAGFAIFLPDNDQAHQVISIAHQLGYNAINAGTVLASDSGRKLIIEPLNVELNGNDFLLQK